MTDTNRQNLTRLAREYTDAVECIANYLREFVTEPRDMPMEGYARAILSRLSAHDPPLLIGTGDERAEIERLRAALQGLMDVQDDPELHDMENGPRRHAVWLAAMEQASEALRGTR
jgi:hypothetical protein